MSGLTSITPPERSISSFVEERKGVFILAGMVGLFGLALSIASLAMGEFNCLSTGLGLMALSYAALSRFVFNPEGGKFGLALLIIGAIGCFFGRYVCDGFDDYKIICYSALIAMGVLVNACKCEVERGKT